jgi:hypothetical protein
MACVVKNERNAVSEIFDTLHRNPAHKRHKLIDVFLFVKRFKKILALSAPFFIDIFKISQLQEARVSEHYIHKIDRCRTGINEASETTADKLRKIT